MTDTWKVFAIHWSEGDPIAVCAPDFGAALEAARDHVNDGIHPDHQEWTPQDLFLSWILRIEIVSQEPIVVCVDLIETPAKKASAEELAEIARKAFDDVYDVDDGRGNDDAAWANVGRVLAEREGQA